MMARIYSTPWGLADHAHRYAEGIWYVTTPSHGGFHVDERRLALMPEPLARMATSGGWFEQDCSWAAVAIAFPERFRPEDVDWAWDTLRRWCPEAYADMRCREPVVPEHLRQGRALAAAHRATV